MCKMAIGAAEKNKRVLFSVPRRDLLAQTSETFKKYGIHHSFIAAGRDYNPFSKVFIGMVDTMANRLDKLPKVSLAIFDETHFGAGSLSAVINKYKSGTGWVIGPSATPWKLNGQGLGIYYDSMVMGKSIKWLIANKRLSDYKYFYGKKRADFHALQKKSDAEIDEFMSAKREIIGDAVSDYKLRCLGKLHIVRCTSIKHSEISAQAFRDAGISAMHVDGKTADDEKIKIFKAFARREIKVLTFAQLLNFGFDLSQATQMDVCIESASDLKPSKSLAAQMQFWGRALRYKPFPAIFNDHVNNWYEHGLPCSDREWTLESLKKKAGGDKVPPTRQCYSCFFVHSPAPSCPECGMVYEITPRLTKEVQGDLVEIDKNAVKLKRRIEMGKLESIDDFIQYGLLKGYKTGWASHAFMARQQKMDKKNV